MLSLNVAVSVSVKVPVSLSGFVIVAYLDSVLVTETPVAVSPEVKEDDAVAVRASRLVDSVLEKMAESVSVHVSDDEFEVTKDAVSDTESLRVSDAVGGKGESEPLRVAVETSVTDSTSEEVGDGGNDRESETLRVGVWLADSDADGEEVGPRLGLWVEESELAETEMLPV
jgi:hypothetical protein